MTRRFSHFLIIFIVIFLAIGSGIVAADEGITLQELADRIAVLAGRVDALESKQRGTDEADTAVLEGLEARIASLESQIAELTSTHSEPSAPTLASPRAARLSTPTPDASIPRLLFEEIEKEHERNRFVARRKYEEYEGVLVEIAGEIRIIGNNWDGRGLPYIEIGYVPEVHCTLSLEQEDVLYQIQTGDSVVIRGILDVWDEIDNYLFIIIEDCAIVSESEAVTVTPNRVFSSNTSTDCDSPAAFRHDDHPRI